MIELMFKMTFWLVTAMALGFSVAWLLSRIVYRTKHQDKEDALSAVIVERNNLIDKLEKKLRNEKILFKKVSENLKNSEKAFAQKTSALTSLRSRFENISSSENENLEFKQKYNTLVMEAENLREIDRQRENELRDFEVVLLRAENKLEESEKHYQTLLKNLDRDIDKLRTENEVHIEKRKLEEKKVAELKESLKLYEADSSEAEFIISKDQFVKIEEQLEAYQKEIAILKNKNHELLSRLKKENSFEEVLEDKIVESPKDEGDDSSMVKVFRQTYKKITKS